MFLEANKYAFKKAVEAVSPLLPRGGDDSSNPTDPAKFLNVRLADGKLTIDVVRQDMTAAVAIEDKSLFKYPPESEGKSVAFDARIWSLLDKHDIDDLFTIEWPENPPAEEKGEEEGVKPLKALGLFTWIMPSRTNKKEHWKVHGWECASKNPSFEKGTDRTSIEANKFAEFAGQVAFMAGDDSGNIKYKNILIRIGAKDIEFVAMNPFGLGRILRHQNGSSGEFSLVIPGVNFPEICASMPNKEKDVDISCLMNDKIGSAVFSQPFELSGKAVGKTMVKVSCAPEPFSKFEKTIGMLSFKDKIKFNREQAREVLGRVSVFADKDNPHVVVEIDPVESSLNLHKNERKGSGLLGGIPLSLCQSEALSVIFPVRILDECLKHADSDDIELDFSGLQTLSKFTLGQDYFGYIQPRGVPAKKE